MPGSSAQLSNCGIYRSKHSQLPGMFSFCSPFNLIIKFTKNSFLLSLCSERRISNQNTDYQYLAALSTSQKAQRQRSMFSFCPDFIKSTKNSFLLSLCSEGRISNQNMDYQCLAALSTSRKSLMTAIHVGSLKSAKKQYMFGSLSLSQMIK
jgi:hypothetical protein